MNIPKPIHTFYQVDGDDELAPMDRGNGPDLWKMQQKVGSWRGLFDTGSYQYKMEPNTHTKWEVIEHTKAFHQCGFDGLVYLFIQDCIIWEHQDRIAFVHYAVMDYAQHYREAEDFLLRCKHPIFLKAAGNLEKHWKISLRQKLLDNNLVIDQDRLIELLLNPPFQANP